MNKTDIYGLTHAALLVKDIQTTLNFYAAVFGMEVMYHSKDFLQLTTPGCSVYASHKPSIKLLKG